MATTGTATIDFGAAPGGEATQVVVTGQAGIIAGSAVEAWIMVTSTADHNAEEHAYVSVTVRCGSIVPGTGFTIFARSPDLRLTGTFTVHWVWA